MANETKPEIKIYTPSEVMQILEKAKELGISYIRLAGFDAAFNVQRVPNPAPAAQQDIASQFLFQQAPAQGDGRCVGCGAPTLEEWHQWCMGCFQPSRPSRPRGGRGGWGRGRRYY